jgi:hypothetical protein
MLAGLAPTARELVVGGGHVDPEMVRQGSLGLLDNDPTFQGSAKARAQVVLLNPGELDDDQGGLPASALDDREPGPASLEFRRLARAGLFDGGAVYRECALMTHDERREAAYTAVDSLAAAIDIA